MRLHIRRGIELQKEEKEILEKEKVKPKKKKTKKVVTKKTELVIDSIMDDFKSIRGERITDEQIETELEKIGKLKYNDTD